MNLSDIRLSSLAAKALALLLLSGCAASLHAQSKFHTYFSKEELPDLVQCLPAPPDTIDPEFARDIMRYLWGKTQRLDKERAEMAVRDAVWTLEALLAEFNEPFGMEISPEKTPEIWKVATEGISTIEMIRIEPKKFYFRKRPFDRFNEHLLTPWEEDELRGEGSYPSGHTIRGWAAALILAEINPDAAEAIFKRGWMYGESRVIVGAHWQSDVDASRPAASIGYAKLQTSPEFQAQMAKAKKEFQKLSRRCCKKKAA